MLCTHSSKNTSIMLECLSIYILLRCVAGDVMEEFRVHQFVRVTKTSCHKRHLSPNSFVSGNANQFLTQ